MKLPPPCVQMLLSYIVLLLASSVQQYVWGAGPGTSSHHLQHITSEPDSKSEHVIVVTSEGTVHSPHFPHVYPRNRMLVWRLVSSDKNTHIQLTFDQRFGLEDPEDGICKYDYVEVEDLADDMILGRWCGSQVVPGKQVSRGNQIRIRFVSDQYLPAKPGFCIHYSPLTVLSKPTPLPVLQSVDVLNQAMTTFSTVEEVLKYLEPERWQLDIEELYKPTLHLLGRSFIHPKKSRGTTDLNRLKEDVRLYSCTPRNFSVSLREELRRSDTIFWPGCLLVKRCGGNCACCSYGCYDCQCVPTKVTKKYHEVLQMRYRSGERGLHKSLVDVHLEHHEECSCVCGSDSNG